MRKAAEEGIRLDSRIYTDDKSQISEKEIGLIQLLNGFREVVRQAADDYNPSVIANYCYDLAKEFNQFYHDFSIMHEPSRELKMFRLVLAQNVGKIIRLGMGLLGIEVPERM